MKTRNKSGFLAAFLLSVALLGWLGGAARAVGVDFAKIPIVQAKSHFIELYKAQWELFGVNDKLDKAIDEAMDEQISSLMWGTVGVQLSVNKGGIIDKIQEAAGFKFSPVYENFVAGLEETWGDTLKKDILDFYEETNSRLSLSLNDNPMAQAQLRHDYDTFTSSQGNVIIEDVKNGLSEKYHVELSAGAIGTGLLTVVGRDFLKRKLLTLLGRKAATSAAGKIAGAAIPVAGWIMMAIGAWDVYSMVVGAEDTVRQQLHDMNRSMYAREIPLTYWEAMEPYVRDAFIFSYEQLQDSIEKGNTLNNNKALKQLRDGMNKVQERLFADRVAVVEDALDEYEGSKSRLYDYFGASILNVSVKNFETLVLMIRHGEWEGLKGWIDFAGVEECCGLYNSLPYCFWAKLPADQASMAEAVRLAALPKDAAEKELNQKPSLKFEKPVEPEEEKEQEKATKKPVPPALTGLDKTRFAMKAKESFMSAYVTQWEERMMPALLHDVVDKAIEEQTKDLMWGTVSVQLRMNSDNIIHKIQGGIDREFYETYVGFLNTVKEKWEAALQEEALNFYRRADVRLLAGENNPMSRAGIIRDSSDLILSNRERLFKEWFEKERSWATLSVAGEFFSMNNQIYAVRMPEILWKAVEPYVTEAFIEAYGGVEK